MPFTATPTDLPGVLLLEPKVFEDARGSFYESFNARDFEEVTGQRRVFVQDNHSLSRRGVLRGLHYQVAFPQGKLVRVIRGGIFDVAVDLRRDSPSFGRWAGKVLTAENRRQMWIPEGFGHGFVVLSDMAEVLYKTTEYWHPEDERSLLWNDPAIGIDWPVAKPTLAAKDVVARRLDEADVF